MNRVWLAVLAVFACLVLVAVAEPALADCLGGGGGRERRRAPTRSSLSGLGVGLGAVGRDVDRHPPRRAHDPEVIGVTAAHGEA